MAACPNSFSVGMIFLFCFGCLLFAPACAPDFYPFTNPELPDLDFNNARLIGWVK